MEEEPFFVERAKGGRASCKGCKTTCPAGELRVAKVTMGRFSEEKPMKLWYHLDCLMAAFMKQRPTTKRIQTLSEIGNFGNLSDDDKEFVLKRINDNELEYTKKHKIEFKPIKDEEDGATDAKIEIKDDEDKYDHSHADNKFGEFCKLCKNIAKDSKYTIKTEIVRSFFSEGTDRTGFKSDIALWCRLLLPGVIKRIYNLRSKQLVKLFSKILNQNLSQMLVDLEQGSVAETIENFYIKSAINAPTESTLTVFEIDKFLSELSTFTKEDEQIQFFKTIVKKCTPNDLKYLIYLINGDLRINAGPKHILGAVHPDAFTIFESSRDIDIVISKVMSKNDDIASPKKTQIKAELVLMKPVHPMLAQACKSVQMAFEKCKNGMLSEIKYDGERVQVHKSGSDFTYFSRSLKPVLSHKISRFKNYIPKAFPQGVDMILDSEILMVDTNTGKPLPFGTLGIHKKGEFKDAEVCLFVFDCLYYNGKSLINEPMRIRRKILVDNMVEIKNHVVISEVKVIHKEQDLTDMIIKVLKLGLEGLVLKDLESKYEPGKRHWLKVKKDYLFEGAMADSADLVVLGAWFGTGKKGGMLSVFLMGCYDTKKDQWLTVTKVHTGHDDAALEGLQSSLLKNMTKISKEATRVPPWLKCTNTMIPDFVAKDPKKQPVWEIMGTEFTQAQIHTANGISIRFPRVVKIRDDKDWKTATSLQELQTLFEKSKESTDVTLLEKMKSPTKRSSPAESKPSKKVKINLDDVPSTSAVKNESEDEIDIAALEMALNHAEKKDNTYVPILKPVEPLLKTFLGCTIGFYFKDNSSDYYEKEVTEMKRYSQAYGGLMDQTKDCSKATHVIHFTDKIRMKDLHGNAKYNFSKSARHVSVNWMKDSIKTKEIQNTMPYSVILTN